MGEGLMVLMAFGGVDGLDGFGGRLDGVLMVRMALRSAKHLATIEMILNGKIECFFKLKFYCLWVYVFYSFS